MPRHHKATRFNPRSSGTHATSEIFSAPTHLLGSGTAGLAVLQGQSIKAYDTHSDTQTHGQRGEPSGGKALSHDRYGLQLLAVTPEIPRCICIVNFVIYKFWQKMLDTCLMLDICLKSFNEEDDRHTEKACSKELQACQSDTLL